MTPDLSAAEARRIILAAQGFADALPKGSVTKRHLHRVIGRTGVLQLDSVNIVSRPQYVVPYSRLGPYDRGLLEAIAYRDRAWFEYWGHAASLIPVERYPLFRSRMEWIRKGVHKHSPAPTWDGYMKAYLKRERPVLTAVLAEVAEARPIAAGPPTD